ncbi:recombination protein RecR [Mycoplasmopsis bovirhinis]|uniref:recombination protein RecR n=1 Tax=Mycoplasmopsis bovirhinis TaxID=29553 RepID=UPI000C05CDCF|nr:recombination protein RecR [Mycoplasmopsis bovirhinis]ATO30569.1 recombination protein RecR [Mycoplasmopsis bovirhinis]
MFNSEKINETILRLTKLPGITKKTAEKIIYWILESSEQEVNLLANSFKSLKHDILFCQMCTAPLFENHECSVCNDQTRENKLLIVESLQIMQKIEKAKFYKGKYFVFRKKLLSETIINKEMNLINELITYARTFDEVIFGISPNIDGEITKHVLRKFLEKKNLNLTELAVGLPIGSSVDYIDEITLKLSLENRKITPK